jgi:hypothetical protein
VLVDRNVTHEAGAVESLNPEGMAAFSHGLVREPVASPYRTT